MPDVFGNDLVPWLRENGFVHKTGRPDEVAAHVERFLTGDDV